MRTIEEALLAHRDIPTSIGDRYAMLVRYETANGTLYAVQYWTLDTIERGHYVNDSGIRFELVQRD